MIINSGLLKIKFNFYVCNTCGFKIHPVLDYMDLEELNEVRKMEGKDFVKLNNAPKIKIKSIHDIL